MADAPFIPDLKTLPDDPAALRQIIVVLLEQRGKDQAQMAHLKEQVKALLSRLYGRKSEKWDPKQGLLTDILAEALSQPAAPVPESAPVTVGAHPRRHTPHGRTKDFPDTIRHEEHIIKVPDEQRKCPVTGQERPVIGYEITKKIDYIPAELIINVYKREKLGSISGAEEVGVLTAPAISSAAPRSLLDDGLIAQLIVSKYADHLPLYRQEQMFARLGLNISRKTMCGTLMAVAEPLARMADRIKMNILASPTVHHDDTPVDLLLERLDGERNIREARLWAASVTPRDGPWVYFEFATDRSADTAERFFRDYKGNIICDAYRGYDALENTLRHLCGCWVHVRRKFFDAFKSGQPEAVEALEIIRELYLIERETPMERTFDTQRLTLRQHHAWPLLGALLERLLAWEGRVLPKSLMGKAVRYALNNWNRLLRFLENPALPLDNNAIEQMIRPVALGRKNWLFVGSEAGGHAAAVYMTIMATCKRANVNPAVYFKDILGRIMDHPVSRLDELLPGIWKPINA